MTGLSRRHFLGSLAASAALARLQAVAQTDQAMHAVVTFSFGTYGMQGLKVEQAINTLADIGYDGIELCVRPEWDGSPASMPAERRRAVRVLLAERRLKLTALMEHLFLEPDDRAHAAGLERLRQAAALGHELAPDAPPLIQTVLGGGTWQEKQNLFVERLASWARLAEETRTVIGIKPHRGGAMSRPEEAVWLIQQLGATPWIRIVYDYSHYAFRDMPLEETVRTALPHLGHVAIKDAVLIPPDRVTFALPGESRTFDYVPLFRLLREAGYRGDICCEVSSQISSRPGYAPIEAAQACYRNIAPAFEEAALLRVTDPQP